jgi:1,4-dihydroxy-2-naphthoate octaprenyltransferase
VIGPQHTRRVMLVLIGLALVWEAVSVLFGQHATISEWVWAMSTHPAFVFACGFLCGHLFFQRDGK